MEKEKSREVQKTEETKKTNYETIAQTVIITVLVMLIVYNGFKIYSVDSSSSAINSGIGVVSASEVIPKGTPEVYGEELGIKYDDVSPNNLGLAEATIQKLSAYEDETLNNAQMERYIRIGSSISCEYCCGAEAIIFNNGQRACGCAHSYAMRGLAKYLLINHPEMSDLQILNELGKWKVLFFPGIHEQKAAALKANGIDYTNESVGYVYLASNLYRGIENQATTSSSGGSQMVGGC